MSEDTITQFLDPSIADRRLRSNLPRGGFASDPMTDLIRNGARRLLQQAVEAELETLLAVHTDERTKDGRARLVRHGYLPERDVLTGAGQGAACSRSW